MRTGGKWTWLSVAALLGVGAAIATLTATHTPQQLAASGPRSGSQITHDVLPATASQVRETSTPKVRLRDSVVSSTATQHEPRAFQRRARATDTPVVATPHLAHDVRRVATTIVGGEPYALYVGRQSDAMNEQYSRFVDRPVRAMSCLFLQDGQGRGGGGCNPASDPFGGSPVWWGAYMSNERPKILILSGVVEDGVSAVRIAFDRTPDVAVDVSADDGFIYGIAKDAIGPADVPTAIVSVARDGHVIARTPLGITFAP